MFGELGENVSVWPCTGRLETSTNVWAPVHGVFAVVFVFVFGFVFVFDRSFRVRITTPVTWRPFDLLTLRPFDSP